ELALPDNGETWPVDIPFVLQTVGWGTSVTSVRLVEFPLDENGNVVGERDVAVQYHPLTDGRLPGETRGRIERTEGGPLLALDDFEQGASYEVQITEARTPLGAPLQAPALSAFATAPALRVTAYAPENGERDVAPGFDPIITFSAPIANPEAAEDAIVVEPA